MNETKLEIKLSFVQGLQSIVLQEISAYPEFVVVNKNKDSIFINFVENFGSIKNLRSVARAYLVLRDLKYNPLYISNHKSVLGGLIETVINKNEAGTFKTFKVTCAGADSSEVKEINRYIENTYGLSKAEEVDLKIHIIKIDDLWEVGVQTTARPLSFREYKVENMSGAMDPTVAFSMNYLCGLEQTKSYLNIFSGSATLLIEAGQCYPNLDKIIGFDFDKEHLSLSIQNIKKAGLIKKIQVKEADIFDNVDFGKFDVITSDLPFGMVISKDEDLEKLYKAFIKYSEEHINPNGTLSVYTSESEILERIILESKFEIINTIELMFVTSVNAYLRPKIFICKLRQDK